MVKNANSGGFRGYLHCLVISMKYFVAFFWLVAHMALAEPRGAEGIVGDWPTADSRAAMEGLLDAYQDDYLSSTWYWSLGLMGDWTTPEGLHYRGLGLLNGSYLQHDGDFFPYLSGVTLEVFRSYHVPGSVLSVGSLSTSLVVGSSLEIHFSDSLTLDITYVSTYCFLKDTWSHGCGVGLGFTL